MSGETGPAYRTISDVATLVGVPQHVLRFWESKFPVIAPLKRGGNRRYYRPADVAAIERVARLLHVEGYTIKGVQKLLAAEPGVSGARDFPLPLGPPRPRAATGGVAQRPATGEIRAGSAAVVMPADLITIAAIRADLAAALAAARAP